jgi:hypothetical protein
MSKMSGSNRKHLDAEQILQLILPKLKVEKGPDARGEYLCWCCFHRDGQGTPPHAPNLKVSIRGFICFACGEKGSLKRLADRLGISVGNAREPRAVYDYLDEQGNLLFQVCRYANPKNFLQRRPRPADWKPCENDCKVKRYDSQFIWNTSGCKCIAPVRKVLFDLPYLMRVKAEQESPTVWICSGERDAINLK